MVGACIDAGMDTTSGGITMNAWGGEAVAGRSIRTEVVLLCTLSVLLISMLTGGIAYRLLEQQAVQRSLKGQQHLAEMRTRQINAYVEHHLQQLVEMSQSLQIATAVQSFDALYDKGVKSAAYQRADGILRERMVSVLERWNYYDAFLIDLDGNIVFTVAHEDDFATNLEHGPYRDSGLAESYRHAKQLLSPDISTFAFYSPSDAPAAFIAAPIFAGHRMLGVLAFQLDAEAFYEVIGDMSGLGATGEVVVGKQQGSQALITAPTRSNPSAAFSERVSQDRGLATVIKAAVHGETGAREITGEHGKQVLAAGTYLPTLNWGLVVHVDRSEALQDLYKLRNELFFSLLAALLLVLVLVSWRSVLLLRPLRKLTRATVEMNQRRQISEQLLEPSPFKEINQLSASFEQMYQEIDHYHRHLEEMVAERTAQLSRLHAAIEQSHDIVIITDRDAVIQYVNPAFELASGYRRDEAIGRSANLVKSGEMSDAFYKEMWDAILAGDSWQADFINRKKSGELYEVEQVISPMLNDAGEVTGFVSVQRDVTLERKQQQQLEHSQRLESLGVLAGGIAHDFNNLLTAILGNAGLARRRIGDESPVAANLKHIEEASERAADLCKQMLAYSGKGKFVVMPVNLSELIKKNLELLKVSIGKNVCLRTGLDPDIPNVLADRAQMQQVIMNLVINASEAIGEEAGTVIIHTGVVMVDDDYLKSSYINEPLTAGRYVFVEVSDTGCGMDEETKKRLYDPFFTTKFTGRGLGMSAILGIVRGHHGAIKLYSEVGQGTTFKVLLPAEAGEQSQAVEEENGARSEAWRGSGRILVVDDEPAIRQTASLMLSDLGFDVVTAVDGQEAVALYQREFEQIDLVLLDMTMPRMDGKSAFREMRRINPDAKVILSSGYNEQEATSHFAGKGLAGFIQKPYRFEILREKMFEFFSS